MLNGYHLSLVLDNGDNDNRVLPTNNVNTEVVIFQSYRLFVVIDTCSFNIYSDIFTPPCQLAMAEQVLICLCSKLG